MMQCREFKVIVSKDTQRADREVNVGNTQILHGYIMRAS